MRFSLALALVSMLVSAPVFAAEDDDGGKDKKGKEKKKGDAEKGPSMDGADPADSEKSDDGPFKPKSEKPVIDKETGKVEPPPKPRPRDPIVVYVEPVIGFGQTFSPSSSAADQVSAPEGTIVTVEAGGFYDLSPKMSLGLRLAWSTANVDQPGGTSASSAAFASPELMFEYRHALSPVTTLPILIGLGIPVAQGTLDPSDTDTVAQRQGGVNALADASHGLRDGELYQPKRFPVILGAGLRHERGALDLHASTKFVFGLNTGGDVKTDTFYGDGGTIKANAFSIRNVTLAGIMYQFLEKPALSGGLDAWFSYRAIDPVEFESALDATPPSSFQFVIEPKLGARFGKLNTGAGFLFPVGGQLGDAGMKGVRLHASYAL